jgi:hypothetical protein
LELTAGVAIGASGVGRDVGRMHDRCVAIGSGGYGQAVGEAGAAVGCPEAERLVAPPGDALGTDATGLGDQVTATAMAAAITPGTSRTMTEERAGGRRTIR